MHIFGRVRVTNRQRHVLDMKIHYFGVQITTVVSGSHVREIFLNNDFDFQLGMRRVKYFGKMDAWPIV